MAEAKRDQNHVPTLLAVSNVDGVTPVVLWADPVTHRLLVNLAAGDGTVTDVSVVTANGFAGTVANSTTTPAITLTTTVTGIIKGNGTAISAAVAGSDYTDLAFKTYAVSGQTDIVADSASDTFTFVAGTGITMTTAADALTIGLTVDPAGYANTALSNLAAVAINTALLPGVSDSIALGSTGKMWSDLFLGDAAVINFNSGNYTVTHSAGNLAFSGNIIPSATDDGALGDATHQFADLFLAEGGVINWDGGDITITQTNNVLAIAGLSDMTVAGNVTPLANDGGQLGSATVSWSDLFLASGAVLNFANGNVTVTHTSGILTMGVGTLKITTPTNDATSVVTIDGTQTLTNKTITSATDILGGVTMTLGSDADGDTYYRASNVLTRLAKGSAGQVLTMNAGATAPEWASGGSLIAATAHQDLTAGDVVGNSSLIANTVAKAVRSISTATTDIVSPLYAGGGINSTHACEIGGDKFVFLQYTAAGSDTLFAVVGQVNTATKTLTVGASASVATAITPVSTALPTATVCKLDTDKFIVIYLADASTTNIQYRIGTVSGTTITFGTAATLITAGSTVATTNAFVADFLGTDKAVFVFKAATTTNSKVVVLTASGTVATAGTPVTPGTNTRVNATSVVRRIATDKFMIACQDAANSMYVQIGTVSGTTITLGTEVQNTTTSSTNAPSLECKSSADDVFVISWFNSSTVVNLAAYTVSGTTPTAGTAIQITTGASSITSLFYTSSTSFYFLVDTTLVLTHITRSGTTLTIDQTQSRNLVGGAPMKGLELASGDYVIIEYANVDTKAWVYGMSNNFMGIAQSTVSKGQSVNVLVRGIDTHQTGLAPGSYYQVNTGALFQVADNATLDANATPLSTNQIVRAISSTQIII